MPNLQIPCSATQNIQTDLPSNDDPRTSSSPLPIMATQADEQADVELNRPLLCPDEPNNTTSLSVVSWKDVESNRASAQSWPQGRNRHAFVMSASSEDEILAGAFDGTFEPKAELQRSASPASFHLYNMSISHQLRARSRPSEEVSLDDSSKPWNQPSGALSLNSFIVVSTTSNGRQISGGGSQSERQNPTDPVRNIRDAGSSIYSRSMDQSPYVESSQLSIIDMPYTVTPPFKRDEPESPLAHKSQGDDAASMLNARSSPGRPQKSVSEVSLEQEIQKASPNSTSPGLLQVNRPSLSKASSSSSLGKISRFRENLTISPPMKRLVKKKGSLFCLKLPFQHAKDRKACDQGSEELKAQQALLLDGPADQSNKLSVPEILRRVSSGGTARSSSDRSLSFVSAQSQRQESADVTQATHLTPSPIRQDSLADYERSLTVQGDNRRRKSTVNMRNLHDVQQDDRRESIAQLTHPLHRAQPLFGPKIGEQSLMEKALQQHQREKAALFRKRDRIPATHIEEPQPVFSSSFGPSTTPARITSGFDDVDPLSALETRRVQSMHQLRPAVDSPPARVLKAKASTFTSSSKSTRTFPAVKLPPASWSRFPSHMRKFRSGSAGLHDAVVARDFADKENALADTADIATNPPTTPIGKFKASLSKKKKPHSATFGHVWRYYTHIFSSTSAQNRRSSINMGGKLKHPELEILPHMSPEHHHHHVQMETVSPRARSVSHLDRFAERMKAEAHEMQDMVHAHHHEHVDKGKGKAKVDVRTDSVVTHDGQREDQRADKAGFLSPSSAVVALDGSADVATSGEKYPSSPASRLSDMYRQTCVRIPNSLDVTREVDPQSASPSESPAIEVSEIVFEGVPVPSVQAGAQTSSDAEVSNVPDTISTPLLGAHVDTIKNVSSGDIKVRHFPSVTVIDDRKGHWRSISLISAKSGGSNSVKCGSVRESTNDLLASLGRAEENERKRLQALAEGSYS